MCLQWSSLECIDLNLKTDMAWHMNGSYLPYTYNRFCTVAVIIKYILMHRCHDVVLRFEHLVVHLLIRYLLGRRYDTNCFWYWHPVLELFIKHAQLGIEKLNKTNVYSIAFWLIYLTYYAKLKVDMMYYAYFVKSKLSC